MPEQFTTYWPTYEGLRVLQNMDENRLEELKLGYCEMTRSARLIEMSQLKICIRERAQRMSDFERLARAILTGQQAS